MNNINNCTKNETRPVLSICIPTTNRCDMVVKLVKNILTCQSQKFDIIVFDGRSTDNTKNAILSINDKRLHYFVNEAPEVTWQTNWAGSYEHADGTFFMHFNDRDIPYPQNLSCLIEFLEQNKNLAGGMCGCSLNLSNKIMTNFEECILKIAYTPSHPTGTVFNTDMYKSIADRKRYYEFDISTHCPHSIIFARLLNLGSLFSYDDKVIWNLTTSDANFKSGCAYKQKQFWFTPEGRLKTLQCLINDIKLNKRVDAALYKRKLLKEITSTISWSTAYYFFRLSDRPSAYHGGYTPVDLTLKQRLKKCKRIAKLFASNSDIASCMPYTKIYALAIKFTFAEQIKAPIRSNFLYKPLQVLYYKYYLKKTLRVN